MNYNYKHKSYYKSTMICQNCGKKGHHFKICHHPKNSYGIIVYTRTNNINKYLLICRRNTIGFVQFIRGKYVTSDIAYIIKLFNVMTYNEIEIIQNKDFSYLWEYLWLDKFYSSTLDTVRKDYDSAEKKFTQIKKGIMNDNILHNINFFIKNKLEFYKEPEWGFPKGRRNIKDQYNKDTAIREFAEETNISVDFLTFIEEPSKLVEEYKSYDNIEYKNTYYLAKYIGEKCKFEIDINNKEQFTEVSNINFYTLDECADKIRNYSNTKIVILKELDKIINDIYK